MTRRRLFRDLSIRGKLMGLGLLASGTSLLLISTAFVVHETIAFPSLVVRKLSIQAQIVGANSLSALLFNDSRSAANTLAALRADPGIVSAGIYDRDGRLFADYVRPEASAAFGPPQQLPEQPEGHRFEEGHLVLLQRVRSDAGVLGTVYIQSDLDELYQRIESYVLIAGVVLLVSFLVAVFIVIRLQRSISRPILQLVQTASEVAARKDYSVRAVAEGQDEIGLLGAALNGMLEQIQRRDAQLQATQDELEHRVIERTEQYEAANQELEAFCYSVSHDLRTPLRAINGFAGALMEDHAEALEPEAKRFLTIVRNNASKMGQLIDDLLEFSRLSRHAVKPAEIDMSSLTQSVIEDLRQAPGSGSATRFVVGELPPAWADRNLLYQVLLNLLSNAVKYSRPSEAPVIEVGAATEDGETVYHVRDNGVGFDMQYVDKLFGVFQRLHRADEFEGTGVGLALVHRIVRRHGGRVWARGHLGEGATFYFTIPAPERDAGPGL